MSKMKHTPGPWMADAAPDRLPQVITDYQPTLAVADRVYNHNERLIAAAPDLLEALEFALAQTGCDGDLCTEGWHEEARKAIAKARGE